MPNTILYIFMYYLICFSWPFYEVDMVIAIILQVKKLRHGVHITCPKSHISDRAILKLESVAAHFLQCGSHILYTEYIMLQIQARL